MTAFIAKNIYSFLVFLLILTSVGGGYLVDFDIAGVNIFLYRILLGVTLVVLISTKKITFYTSTYSKYVFFVLVTWLGYGLFSFLWAPSFEFALKEILTIFLGLATYTVFFSIQHNFKEFYTALENHWLIVFLAVLFFAVLEIFTQYHLDGDHFEKLTELGSYHPANFIPIFTFGNPNHFAVFLTFSLALSVFFLLQGAGFYRHITVIFAAINCLTLLDSRLSFFFIYSVVFVLIVLFSLRFVRKSTRFLFSYKKLFFVLSCGVLSWLFPYLLNTLSTVDNAPLSAQKNTEMNKELLPIQEDTIVRKTFKSMLILGLNQPIEGSGKIRPDLVFPIEKKTQYRMIDGDTVNLTLLNLPSDELIQQQLFSTGKKNENALGIVLSLFLVCLFTFLIWKKSKLNRLNLMFVLFGFGLYLVGIFMFHPFKQPNSEFRRSIIVDADSLSSKTFVVKELNSASFEAVTGNRLKEGKVVPSYILERDVLIQNSPNQKVLSSDEVRKNLFLNGIDLLRESNYFGGGAGSFKEMIYANKNRYPVGNVLNPHNFIIEICAQYGVFIFALLLGMILWPLAIITSDLFAKKWSNHHTFVIVLVIGMLFMGNANSNFLPLTINWIHLTLILIVSNELIANRKRKNDSKNSEF